MAEVTAAVASSSVPNPGLFARIVGVIFSPRETYAAVAARPKWLGVMAITLVIGAVGQYVMLSSPELQDNIIDQQVIAMRERGAGSEQQIAAVESLIERLPLIYLVGSVVVGPLAIAAMAGLFMLVFSMLMGGSGTFKQVFAVITHSGVISTLAAVFSAALTLAGVPPSGVQPPSANLGVFAPMLDEMSFFAMFLGSFNLILIWWVLSISIGLGVLYKRRTAPIFVTFMCIYVLGAAALAYVRS
jgi:hypothetical protein